MFWFSIRNWLFGRPPAIGFEEIDAVLKQVAISLKATASHQRNTELALIVTPPFALFFHIQANSGVIQPYCALLQAPALDLNSAMRLRFHQRGEKFERNSWVWFSRLSPEGATSYRIQMVDSGSYQWFVDRARPAKTSSVESNSRKQLIADVSSKIAHDFLALRSKLEAELNPA